MLFAGVIGNLNLSRNADIHPKYVTTVKIGEALTAEQNGPYLPHLNLFPISTTSSSLYSILS